MLQVVESGRSQLDMDALAQQLKRIDTIALRQEEHEARVSKRLQVVGGRRGFECSRAFGARF